MLWYDVSTFESIVLIVAGIAIYVFGLVVGGLLRSMPRHGRRGRRTPRKVDDLGFDPSNPMNRNAAVNQAAVESQSFDGWYLRDWRDGQ